MKKIAIVGAGGFGREVKMLIDQINETSSQYDFQGFFDDGFTKNALVNGFPVLGGLTELNAVSEELLIVVAIGLPSLKKSIIEAISNEYIDFATLIHPGVIVDRDFVSIAKGSIICAGTIVTVNIEIGRHVIINLACTVGHDTKIKDYTSIMPAVNISGEVVIGTGAYVGTGAKIINQVEIGEFTIVGAGAIVSKSLPANCTAVGIPAKPIKFHHEIS